MRGLVAGRRDKETGEMGDEGFWYPDTPEVRADFEILLKACNYTHGEGSHWIEEREA